LTQLVTKELQYWSAKAYEKHHIKLKWDPKALEALAQGYNVHYGARSIKHEVERRVVNQLAAAHENQKLEPHTTIYITAQEVDSSSPGMEDEFVIKLKVQTKGEELIDLDNPITSPLSEK